MCDTSVLKILKCNRILRPICPPMTKKFYWTQVYLGSDLYFLKGFVLYILGVSFNVLGIWTSFDAHTIMPFDTPVKLTLHMNIYIEMPRRV